MVPRAGCYLVLCFLLSRARAPIWYYVFYYLADVISRTAFYVMFSTIPRTGVHLVQQILCPRGLMRARCRFHATFSTIPRTCVRLRQQILCPRARNFAGWICTFAGGHLYVTFSTIPRTGVHLVQQILCPRVRTCAPCQLYATFSTIPCTGRV